MDMSTSTITELSSANKKTLQGFAGNMAYAPNLDLVYTVAEYFKNINSDVNDNFIQPVGGTNYFINTGELGGTDINAWVDVGRPDIAQYMLDNNLDQVYYPGPPGDDTEFQIPLAGRPLPGAGQGQAVRVRSRRT